MKIFLYNPCRKTTCQINADSEVSEMHAKGCQPVTNANKQIR